MGFNNKYINEIILDDKRYEFIDIMRLIAAILVVCIHTSPIEGHLGYILNNIIARIAVPFFFISSGYFVFEKLKLNDNYIKHYIKKIFILYSSWYIIYFLIRCFIEFNEFGIKQFILIIREYLFSGYYQLWYLSSLILSMIIVNFFIKKKKLKELTIISVVLFIIGILGDSYSGIINNKVIETIIYLYNYLFGTTKSGICFAIPFITIGISINKFNLKEKIKNINYLLIISFIGLTIESLLLEVYKIGTGRNIYFMLPIVGALVFICGLNCNIKLNSFMTKVFGRLSLGIYCSHALFIIIFNYSIDFLNINYIYINKIKFLVVLISSLILSLILIKSNTKFLKNLI